MEFYEFIKARENNFSNNIVFSDKERDLRFELHGNVNSNADNS